MGILNHENLNAVQSAVQAKEAEAATKAVEAQERRRRLVEINNRFATFHRDILFPVCAELDGELRSMNSWLQLEEPRKRVFQSEVVRTTLKIMRPDGKGSVEFTLIIADRGPYGEAGFSQLKSDPVSGERRQRTVYELPWPELSRADFEHHINEVMKRFVLNEKEAR